MSPRLAAALLVLAGCCGSALAGCCSTDPADLSDPDPEVRREHLACTSADPTLRGRARDEALASLDPAVEGDAGVRVAAYRALEVVGVEDAAPLAIRLAPGPDQDPSPWVRAAAASTLGAVWGAPAGRSLRLALISDPSREVRLAAARELGERRDAAPETTAALLDALRDETTVVRQVARRALRAIHAADLGLDPDAWREWLTARAAPEPLQLEAPPPDAEEGFAPPGLGDEGAPR